MTHAHVQFTDAQEQVLQGSVQGHTEQCDNRFHETVQENAEQTEE